LDVRDDDEDSRHAYRAGEASMFAFVSGLAALPHTSRAPHRHLTELLLGAPVHIFSGNLFATAMARHTAL